MDALTIILYFIVIPLAVILFSVALQKLINSPLLISAIVFVSFLIVALIFTESTALLTIAAIGLGVLAFITAVLTCILSGIIDKICNKRATNNNNNVNQPTTINSCSRICCCRRICGNRR
ncbi:MAG: DUF2651 family protein [Clostridia bacterium]|nr:DUF2651 family protein [Clostridia bacterium]